MAKYTYSDWINQNLTPIFFNIIDTIQANDIDELFQNIAIGFIKNSNSLFKNVELHLGSYSVAQAMRLLMELVADMDYIISNPNNNIHRIKKHIKNYSKKTERKEEWSKTIKKSVNIHLVDDLSGKETKVTQERVELIFDKNVYDFYCAYLHCNLFAIYDDNERTKSFNDESLKKSMFQKRELIAYYPIVLEQFINSLNRLLNDDNKIPYNHIAFIKEYETLLITLSNSRIKTSH